MKKSVAVFGAGIAGLASAHEFARLDYQVSVYEANREAGGFFRSARMPENGNMPSEYSWHGFGPWYHNAFDVMKQIPFDETGSLYEKAFSRPIDFGIAPDEGKTQFNDSRPLPVSRMLRLRGLDSLRWGWLTAKTWTSNRRTLERYARLNAAERYRPVLSDLGWRTWKATFGPWIGSDWTNVSLHTMGEFFRKLLVSRPPHDHGADSEGPPWRHGQGDGWLLLRGPSSEYWFEKWVYHLEKRGVRFFWEQPLHKLHFDGEKISRAQLSSGEDVRADVYVMATNPFSAADILKRTPELARKDQLCLFEPLVQDGPHTQVSLRIAFAEKIRWPRPRVAAIVADSEYNLTLFAEEQAWGPEVDLGDGVSSLWTVTACVGTVPGRIHGVPVVNCTKEQFVEEVMAQLFSCGGIEALVMEANGGRGLKSFPILRIEVWHEWKFSPDGIRTYQPKWVTTGNTQSYRPTQATPVPNLALAGAHTKTAADVWSIEGAVESGRRAAQAFEPGVKVFPQYRPWYLRATGAVDDALFSIGGPQIIDIVLIAGAVAIVGLVFLWLTA